MRFKTSQIESEFKDLAMQNGRMIRLLHALEIFTQLEFKKDFMITSIYRTQKEHDELYKNTPPAQKPVNSPHMFYEAVDLRSSEFSTSEILRMVEFLNNFTFRNNKNVAMYHQVVGNAFHFHIQFAKS